MSGQVSVRTVLSLGAAVGAAVFTARLLLRARKRRGDNRGDCLGIRNGRVRRIIDTMLMLQKDSVRMKNPDKVEAIVCTLIEGGKDKLQVVADFDYTLTKHHQQGRLCSSCHGIIETSPLLPEGYRKGAKLLKEKYYPIEVDPKISIAEKIPFMVEWWRQAHELLMQFGLKKSDLTQMVRQSFARLRDHADSMLETLQSAQVPVLVFSAGVGDVLEEILRLNNLLMDNIHIISNYMDFDADENLVGFRGNLIHTYNKNENAIHHSKYFDSLNHRNNIILMGDSLGDLQMARAISNPNVVLKIGFLNDKIEERLPDFLENFDIVLVDDQTMDVANGLLQRIL